MTRYVDITPTWRAIMPILIHAIQHGTDEGRKLATEELMRLADEMDKLNKESDK